MIVLNERDDFYRLRPSSSASAQGPTPPAASSSFANRPNIQCSVANQRKETQQITPRKPGHPLTLRTIIDSSHSLHTL